MTDGTAQASVMDQYEALQQMLDDLRDLGLQVTRDHETRLTALERAATPEASEDPKHLIRPRSLSDLAVAAPGALTMSGASVTGSFTLGNVDNEGIEELINPSNPWEDEAVWEAAVNVYAETTPDDSRDFKAIVKLALEAGATLENYPG